jgi:uncharacterized protein with HEPN domain
MPESDQQIIASIIKEIENLTTIMTGKNQFNLEEDLTLERAVCMTLGLIGEKASKVSEDFRKENPGVPWRKIIALRNRIVHSYEDLDFDIIYQIVEKRVPEFKKQLNALVEKKPPLPGGF